MPDDAIHASSGMLMRAAFYEPPPIDRAAERRRLGLDPTGRPAWCCSAARARRRCSAIAKRLPDTPLILACGHNAALARALRALPARAPRLVLDFTPDIAHYMRLADFFIGKPGPGSLSEAVQMQLAGDRGAQPLDAAAGTLQRPVGARAGRRAGLQQLRQGRPGGRRADRTAGPLPGGDPARCATGRCSNCRRSWRASWRGPRR